MGRGSVYPNLIAGSEHAHLGGWLVAIVLAGCLLRLWRNLTGRGFLSPGSAPGRIHADIWCPPVVLKPIGHYFV